MSDPEQPAVASVAAPKKESTTGSALLGAFLTQGSAISTLLVTLATGASAGMFALVDKAQGGWPLFFWIAAVLLYGTSAWCSFQVLEFDKDLVMTVFEKFGAVDDADRSSASVRSSKLDDRIGSWTSWTKGLFLAAAAASMLFAIVSRKQEKTAVTDKTMPQDVVLHGGNMQGIDHRNLQGLSKIVEATDPGPGSSDQAPVEPVAPPSETTSTTVVPEPSE